MKKCAECGAALFEEEVREACDTCQHNGVWDPVTCVYRYPEDAPADRKRDQSGMEWECALGTNFNSGCKILTCRVCGHMDYVPFLSEEVR